MDASEIVPGLFVGNAKSAQRHAEFDMIVNCTCNFPFPQGCARGVRIPVNDDPFDSIPLYHVLRDGTALADIHEVLAAGGAVLVHCMAGAQRSPAVVACYLIKYHGMSIEKAIAHVQTRRPVAFFWGVDLYDAIRAYSRHLSPPDPGLAARRDELLRKPSITLAEIGELELLNA